MTNKVWRLEPGSHSCDSCLALAGQVHPAEMWDMHNLYPGSPRLYCAEHCNCSLVETADPERGDLSSVPLRRAGDPNPEPVQEALMPHPAANQQRVQLTATGQVNAAGQYEIMAITPGLGNGLTFTRAALEASLPLWAGANVFIDHGAWDETGRSLRDLAAVCHSPTYDEGVKLTLQPTGPSAPLLIALAQEMLADTAHKPRVGFSADVILTADPERVVQSILHVLSLDLVYNPARGGAFIRALNQVQADHRQEEHMPNEVTPPAGAPASTPSAPADVEATRVAMQTLLDVQREQEAAAAQRRSMQATHVQMCAYLLDSGLANSHLPKPAQDAIRKQFAGRVFEAPELNTAIEDQRQLVAALTAGSVVQGPGRVHAMYNSRDQLQAAVDDLVGAPRDEPSKTLQVSRLRGIREFYHLMTGDYDMHGGYYPDRAQFQHTTATFTGLVKNAMNKAIVDHWNQLGRAGYDWWQKVATVEHFDTLNDVTWTIFGSIGSLPAIAEGAEYPELKIGDSPETSTFGKYGGYIGITLEALDRDDTRKLRAAPRELANAGIRRISALVAALFTANSGTGPTLADTGALFNSTAVTTAGGHKNLLTTALSASEWEVVATAVYNQPMLIANETGYIGTGAKMAVNPRYLLVPRALQLTGMKILYPTLENAATIYSENQQRGQPGDVITVPEWTDSTDWAAVVDPLIVPGIMIGERFGLLPEVFVAGDELSPAVFMNDESRLKVRHFVTVGVADFRPLHKSNVTGG